MSQLILQGSALTQQLVAAICEQVGGVSKLKEKYTQLKVGRAIDLAEITRLREMFPIDINMLPDKFSPEAVKLVVCDMDSTLINIECIDEIADFAGKKREVSSITEAAMSGELDFAESLTQRVALLKGLDVSVLERVFDERLSLNPGAEQLLDRLKSSDIRFALVSGGFSFFTQKLKNQLGFAFCYANELEIVDQKLTGKVVGDIVDATVKADYLQSLCDELGIEPGCAVAIGDGANDLKMMALAGLGVAYHAKPKVQMRANCTLNHSGLEGLLGLLDI